MRIFVYAPQSSGASVFSYWLGQTEGYLNVIDLFVRSYPPLFNEVPDDKIILKATVSNLSLEEHVQKFKPDIKILYIRNPYQNYVSLLAKNFRDFGCSIDEKFQKLEDVFKKDIYFDCTIKYEDFIEDHSLVIMNLSRLGIPVSTNNYFFKKSVQDVVNFTCSQSKELRRGYGKYWGTGNIHSESDYINLSIKKSQIDPGLQKHVNKLCPNLVSFYSTNIDAHI